MEEISKLQLKLCKIIIKYSPLCIAIGYFIMACCSCFGLVFPLMSTICHLSIISFVSLYSVSKLLKFCAWHRLPLWYSVFVDFLNALFYYFNFPLAGKSMLSIYLLITILFIILGMYLKEKHNAKNRSIENISD